MPALAEPAIAPASHPEAFGTNIGDTFGSLISQTVNRGIQDAKGGPPADKPEKEAGPDAAPEKQEPPKESREAVVREKKAEAKVSAEPTPGEKEEKEKAERGQAEIDGRNGKERVRYSELPPDKREFLLASEARKVEALKTLERERDDLKAKVQPLEEEVTKLRADVEVLPKERDEIRGKYEKRDKEYVELQERLASYDIRQTDEYKQNVAEPWQRDVVNVLNSLAEDTGLNAVEALSAIQRDDPTMLNKLAGSLEWDGQQKLALAVRTGQQLLARDRDYEAKGKDALTAIEQRKNEREIQVRESQRAEVEKHRKADAAGLRKRFPFVADPGENDALKNDLASAEKAAASFDFSKLTPQQQAEATEFATTGKIIINALDAAASYWQKQVQEANNTISEREKKIEELEKRLGNKEGATLVPGRDGFDNRHSKPPEFNGSAANLVNNLVDKVRRG